METENRSQNSELLGSDVDIACWLLISESVFCFPFPGNTEQDGMWFEQKNQILTFASVAQNALLSSCLDLPSR